MLKKTWRWRIALASLFALATATGCGGILVVQDTTHGQGEINFAYTHSATGEQGIIECQLAETGELSDCRDMSVTFQD